LRQLFGPGVEEAVRAYRAAKDDPDLAGLLALFGSTERVVARWRRRDDTIVGMDESGAEIVRVPAREPLRVLPGWDPKLRVVRSNCP